jgi:transposase-like protein
MRNAPPVFPLNLINVTFAASTDPEKVCYGASKRSRTANNVIEQDHRRIKQRVRPMLGFKRFETAAVTIRGIELAEKIKKHQFNLRPITGKATTAPEMWARVLVA